MRLLPSTKSTFGKTLSHRLPMLKSLVSSVILKEQIVTTKSRALAARPIVEQILRNVCENTPEARQEVEQWVVDHRKTMPLLYGPLRTRYHNLPPGHFHTRVFQLPHRQYRHAQMAVIELVNGPRDTVRNMEIYKQDLQALKEKNKDMLFEKPVDELMMGVKTTRKGLTHRMHKLRALELQFKDKVLLEAGKEKCRYVMECFAKLAIGEKLPIKKQPEFWVK